MNKKLMINYGVRWEYFSPTYSNGKGEETIFDLATANMVFAGIGHTLPFGVAGRAVSGRCAPRPRPPTCRDGACRR